MKFERLRLTGFKSFCDSAEFKIEPGLTGVVGPNGCGKSNLVEALRWVMGETSYKSMRGSGMDDVIFGGSGKRPSRNNAEVGLSLDNSDRRAPAPFNDAETIEVTRRIEREAGSTYRVNGREVRARDVQLLFADASTGARSPSLVRQGQIGEIIAARPQARRLILEEAAGVSGLHSRRHEAELRLKGAEDNLLRVEDVLKQLNAQVDSLKRQARQSSRYRDLSATIRRHEALARLIAWREHEATLAEARRRLDADLLEVAELKRANWRKAPSAVSQAPKASLLKPRPPRRTTTPDAGRSLAPSRRKGVASRDSRRNASASSASAPDSARPASRRLSGRPALKQSPSLPRRSPPPSAKPRPRRRGTRRRAKRKRSRAGRWRTRSAPRKGWRPRPVRSPISSVRTRMAPGPGPWTWSASRAATRRRSALRWATISTPPSTKMRRRIGR